MNASPIIVLVKVGRVDLLAQLGDELILPSGSAREILRGEDHDPSAQWLHGEGRRLIVRDAPVAPEVSTWDLGQGETAVLSWAHQNPGCEAIIDDRAARNCAIALDIPVRGTLGVLLLAKKAGLVERVAPIVQEVIAAGLRVHSKLFEDVLRLAGESP